MTDKEKIECLSDLCRFLAIQQEEQKQSIREALYLNDIDKIKYQLAMKTPTIQGTENQINLAKIGKQEINESNVSKAVALLLMGN